MLLSFRYDKFMKQRQLDYNEKQPVPDVALNPAHVVHISRREVAKFKFFWPKTEANDK